MKRKLSEMEIKNYIQMLKESDDREILVTVEGVPELLEVPQTAEMFREAYESKTGTTYEIYFDESAKDSIRKYIEMNDGDLSILDCATQELLDELLNKYYINSYLEEYADHRDAYTIIRICSRKIVS